MAQCDIQRICKPCGRRWSSSAFSAVVAALVLAIALLCFPILDGRARAGLPASGPYQPQFPDRAVFVDAITKAGSYALERQKLTGLTLPHHLLAAPLIAAGLSIVDPRWVKHVVILLPDHHSILSGPFGTTRTDFMTVFGLVHVSGSKTNVFAATPPER